MREPIYERLLRSVDRSQTDDFTICMFTHARRYRLHVSSSANGHMSVFSEMIDPFFTFSGSYITHPRTLMKGRSSSENALGTEKGSHIRHEAEMPAPSLEQKFQL